MDHGNEDWEKLYTLNSEARVMLGFLFPRGVRPASDFIDDFIKSVTQWMNTRCGNDYIAVFAVIERFLYTFDDYAEWLDKDCGKRRGIARVKESSSYWWR